MFEFQAMSDLHLEHRDTILIAEELVRGLPVTASTLILAGDIHNTHIGRALKLFASKWEQVIFVPGNHDYYGERFRYLHAKYAALELDTPNLHILREKRFTDPVSGVRFLGTTLWFERNEATLANQHMMNDFRYIKESQQIFNLSITASDYVLRNVFDEDNADIVITHYLPTKMSISDAYCGDAANVYYVNPVLDRPYRECKAKAWIHGHSHGVLDYQYPGGPRIISNCGGYAWDVEGFDPGRVYRVAI